MKWTDPQVSMLSRLWTEGMTASEIAQALGEGVTRNAVIGKLHRLGLSAIEPNPAGAPDEERTARTENPSVTIADLSSGMCRWPDDQPSSGEFRYCGQTTTGAGPYCTRHAKLAYQPTKPMRDKLDRQSPFPIVVIEAPKP